MKQAFKRIISFSLSICIIVISVFLCPISSYAVYDPGTSWWDKFIEETSTYLSYLACRVGAVVQDHDFAKWYQAREDYEDWWNTGHISRLEDSDGNVNYSFDADLVAQIKQALQEYADETNPFILEKTYNMYEIPASTFRTKAAYDAFRSYCSSHPFTVALPQCSVNYMYLADATPYIKDGGAFVSSGNMVVVMNSDWNLQLLPYDYYQLKVVDGNDIVDITENRGEIQWIAHYDPNKTDFGVFRQNPFIVTPDGGRIRVFKSATEFMNYDAGQRKVYFGSGFYDFDPTDITATWDEINDTLDHMDDILQELLDKITDDTDESTIEDLLQQILDALLNGGGGGSGGGGWIGGAVAQWYDDVLNYLDKILKQLKSIKRWTVVNTVINGVDAIADWLDLIHDVLSDVDDGAESAIATLSDALDDATGLLKSKFPFSVPWDIFFFVTLLSAEPETPYFEVPIDFDVSAISMHIHYDFVVDFSDYKYLSDICRVVLSMTYAVGLMKMTSGIVNTKKEE
ncbi:MAG: hypothetical protein HDR04_06305 [Lachnospiraceae bacterium]|nr:hypothetical protein [Lachnospiraceae bacterium]